MKRERGKWMSRNYIYGVIFLIILAIAALSIYNSFSSTGKAIFSIKQDYAVGENLEGIVKLSMKAGELIPVNSILRVSLGNYSNDYIFRDLIGEQSINGKFYAEGIALSESGEGFGIEGKKITYPEVDFKLAVTCSDVDGNINENVEETPAVEVPIAPVLEETPVVKTPVVPETPSENIPSPPVIEESAASEAPVVETPVIPETPSENIPSPPVIEESAASEAPAEESVNLISGNVIAPNNFEVNGKVSKEKDFEYNLDSGCSAEIVEGSVSVAESVLSLNIVDGKATVKTSYEKEERGFGEDYLGDIAKTISLDLNILNLSASDNLLSIELVYEGIDFAKIEKQIYVHENAPLENETVMEEVVNATVSNLSFVGEIPSIRIKSGENYSLDLGKYFVGADSYELSLNNFSIVFENNILTLIPNEDFRGVRKAIIVAHDSVGQIESNEFNVMVSSGNINVKTERGQIKVGEKVKWTQNISLDVPEQITVQLPASAENISVSDVENSDVEVNGLLTGNVVISLESKEPTFIEKISGKISDFFKNLMTGNVVSEIDVSSDVQNSVELVIDQNSTEYSIEYYTEAPVATENETSYGKQVVISAADELNYTDVLSFTNISEIYDIGEEGNISVYWVENKSYLPFDAYDMDGNGKLDYIEWITPHLSDQTFEIRYGIMSTPGEIGACQVIDTPGVYTLNQSIDDYGDSGTCLNITTDDVVLDGNGFMIRLMGAPSSVYGISGEGVRTNVTIRNFTIWNYPQGISFSGDGIIIHNNIITLWTGSVAGIVLAGTNPAGIGQIYQNIVNGPSGSATGIRAYGTNLDISYNNISSQIYGIEVFSLGINSILTGNILSENSIGISISLSEGVEVSSNIITGIGNEGIRVHNGANANNFNNTISGVLIYGYRFDGTQLNTVAGNVSTNTIDVFCENGDFEIKQDLIFSTQSGCYSWLMKGFGTAEDPYQIDSWAALNATRNNLSAYYILTANLSSSDGDYVGIGDSWVPIGDNVDYFLGSFDGQNNTISDLIINLPDYTSGWPIGLFGYTISNIANVRLNNVNITGNAYSPSGALAGWLSSYGIISNCHVSGNIYGTSVLGGLVGNSAGLIVDSHSDVNISYVGSGAEFDTIFGGLVGYAFGNISNSYATGNVNGYGEVGGFVGRVDSEFAGIFNSYANGSVSGNNKVGGFSGSLSRGIISNSYSTSSVDGVGSYVGGLVGYDHANGGSVSNSYATGNVSGGNSVGGLMGTVSGTINNSNSSGSVEGENYVGGLMGSQNAGTISNSYATGSVNGAGVKTGGLVGEQALGTITNSYSTGSVTGVNNVGGLVGQAGGVILNSYVMGNVTGDTYVGGLVGWTMGTISNSYSSGNVTGSVEVGGFTGRHDEGTINNSYATGNVIGSSYVGGFIGRKEVGTLLNSYSIGAVSGSSGVGGLIGYSAGSIITDSFWNIQTSEQATSDGGAGKTTAQMKNLFTYDVGGWNISANVTDVSSYPYLAWQAENNNYDWIINQAPSSDIVDCGYITSAGEYTLLNNISAGSGNDCLLIRADGVTINGNGFTVTGNVNASGEGYNEGGYGYDAYTSLNLMNIVIVGSIEATGATGQDIIFSTGGNGSTITLTSTNISGNIISYGGNAGGNAGSGGLITLISSSAANINAYGGIAAYGNAGGNGGTISLTNSNVSIISAYGGAGYGGGLGGSLTATNSTIASINSYGGAGSSADSGSGAVGGAVTLTSSQVLGSINNYGGYSGSAVMPGGTGGETSLINSSAQDINSYGGLGDLASGGSGGIIILTNSNATSVDTHGGSSSGGFGLGSGASGGSVTLTNSNATTIISSGGTGGDGGGNGGTIIISNSTTSSITSTGGNGGIVDPSAGGSGGSVTITNSTTGAITTTGGIGPFGGSAGSIAIADSRIETISSVGGEGGYNSGMSNNGGPAGSGGGVSITNSNLTGSIDVSGGYNNYRQAGSGGSVSLTYSNVSGSISAAGGIGGTSAVLEGGGSGGTVTLVDSTSGDINIVGGTGWIGGNGGSGSLSYSTVGSFSLAGAAGSYGSGGNGGSFNLVNSNFTGNVDTSGGNSAGSYYNGGSGGSVIINNSVSNPIAFSITANGGLNPGGGVGGNGGAIAITNSNISSVIANGGENTGGPNPGDDGGIGGTVAITNSTVTTISAYGGASLYRNGGNGGTVTLSYSNITTINSNGGNGGSSSGNGGDVFINNSNLSSISSSGGHDIANEGYTGGGNGGNVIVVNSNLTSIIANGGNLELSERGQGDAGNANLTNSQIVSINLVGGVSSIGVGGSGGEVYILAGSSAKTINVAGNSGGGGVGGNGGNVYLNYSSLQTEWSINVAGDTAGGGEGYVNGTDGEINYLTYDCNSDLIYGSPVNYVLQNNISTDCNVRADNVTIDGNGFTITGNVNARNDTLSETTGICDTQGGPEYYNKVDCELDGGVWDGDGFSAYTGLILQDVIVSGDVSSVGGDSVAQVLEGGSVELVNSTVINIDTSGGTGSGDSGAGGAVNLTNSTATNIITVGGVGYGIAGAGGIVSIINSDVIMINASGGDTWDTGYTAGAGGAVTITNSTVETLITIGGMSSDSCEPGNPDNCAGGAGGAVTITNSTMGDITAFGGLGIEIAGSGATININSSNITENINAYGGASTTGNGGNGAAISLTYSNITGNINAYGGGSVSNNGGNGATINITSSNVSGTINANGGDGLNGGSASVINITSSNISGDINADGGWTTGYDLTNLGGNGATINFISSFVSGNVNTNGGHGAYANGSNVYVSSSDILGNINANGGYGDYGDAGNGATVNLASSNISGSVNNYGGNSVYSLPGNGGILILTNSRAAEINSYGGKTEILNGGDGGNGNSITLVSSNVSGNINAYGGDSLVDAGGNGATINITSSNITGNINASGGDSASGTGGNGGILDISSSNISGDIHANGGNGDGDSNGGNGGAINITSSNMVGSIGVSGGISGNSAGGNGGNAGSVNLSSFNLQGNLDAYGGNAFEAGGSGANIFLRLSNVSGNINAYGGVGGFSGDGGSALTITLVSSNVTGNISANGGNGASGISGNGASMNLIFSEVSGNINANGGETSLNSDGGSGGLWVINYSSIVGNIYASGGDSSGQISGNGATVTVTSSNITSIDAQGGIGEINGTGGQITLTNSRINLSGGINIGNDQTGSIQLIQSILFNEFGELKYLVNVANPNALIHSILPGGIIQVGNNYAYANDSIYRFLDINKSANVTLDLSSFEFVNPRIMKNGVLCAAPNCNILSYNQTSKIIKFNVTSWSNYTISETTFAAGSGTAGDPYQIDSWYSLNAVRNNLTAYYILTENLSSTTQYYNGLGNNWVPIGATFAGNFNGNGKMISNLRINSPSDDAGLFNIVSGNVSSIGLVNVSIIGGQYVGGVASQLNDGTISSSYVTGNIECASSGVSYGRCGGSVGYVSDSGLINNSYSSANLVGISGMGGLVGENRGTISNSYATGNVIGNLEMNGGLVGYQNGIGTISNSYATGNVTGSEDVGGLVGIQEGTISNSYSTGRVTGSLRAGGLVGSSFGTITNSYWDTQTSGQQYSAGDAVGKPTALMRSISTFGTWNINSTLANLNNGYPYLAWQAQNNSYVWLIAPFAGGNGTAVNPYQIASWSNLNNMRNNLNAHYILIANLSLASVDYLELGNKWTPIGYQFNPLSGNFNGNGNTISDLIVNLPSTRFIGLFGYSIGNISNLGLVNVSVVGDQFVGGLSGVRDSAGVISNSYVTGNVTSSSYGGGIVGYQTNAAISNSYFIGNVTGGAYAAGIAGQSQGKSLITGSYAVVNVRGVTSVGGLVGYNWGSTINNSYAGGRVHGSSDRAGGLVGDGYTGNISNSYSTVNVTGVSNVGGLVGIYGDVYNSYWDMQASGQTISAGGTGKTTAQMKYVGTYNSTWNISLGAANLNNGYPYLSWQVSNNSYVWMVPYYNVSQLVDCGVLDIANTNYFLQNNVTSTGVCFNITAANITLNGNGYYATGGYAPNYTVQIRGVYANAAGVKNITIRNVGFAGFGAGIELINVNNSLIENIRMQDVVPGSNVEDAISLTNSSNNIIRNNNINISSLSGGVAIYEALSHNNVISGNVFTTTTNTRSGIDSHNSANITFYNNSFSNFNRGLLLSGGVSGVSLAVSSDNVNQNSFDNCTDGILLWRNASGNTLLNNNFTNVRNHSILTAWWDSWANLTTSGVNYLVYNNSYGQIKFSDNNFSHYMTFNKSLVFGSDIIIGQNIVNVSSALLGSSENISFTYSNYTTVITSNVAKVNSSANITFYNYAGYVGQYPLRLRKMLNANNTCTFCNNLTALNAQTIVFNVSNFGTGNISVAKKVNNSYNVSLNSGWNMISLTMQGNYSGDKNVSLSPGWNLVGYSSAREVSPAAMEFTNATGSIASWDSAAVAGKVQKYVSYYDSNASKNKYLTVGKANLNQGGYWVYAEEAGNLTLPSAGGNSLNETYALSDITFTNGTEEKNISAAVSAGWVSGTSASDTVYYNELVDGYGTWRTVQNINEIGGVACGNFEEFGGGTCILNSWQGYFIKGLAENITMSRQD